MSFDRFLDTRGDLNKQYRFHKRFFNDKCDDEDLTHSQKMIRAMSDNLFNNCSPSLATVTALPGEDFRTTCRSFFCVKGQMGTGKTSNLILPYLKEVFSKDPTLKVLFISVRKTLTGMLYADLTSSNFVSYLEEKKGVSLGDHPRIIISPESLHRTLANVTVSDSESILAVPQYDIVIIDEIVSLLLHLGGKTMERKMPVFGMIVSSLFGNPTTQTIGLDAVLDNDAINFIEWAISPDNNENIHKKEGYSKDLYIFYNSFRPSLEKDNIVIIPGTDTVTRAVNSFIQLSYTREDGSPGDWMSPLPKTKFRRRQLILGFSSKQELMTVRDDMFRKFNFLTKQNTLSLYSDGDQADIRSASRATELWADKLVIFHTSTVQCGTNYDPPLCPSDDFLVDDAYILVVLVVMSSEGILPDIGVQMILRCRKSNKIIIQCDVNPPRLLMPTTIPEIQSLLNSNQDFLNGNSFAGMTSDCILRTIIMDVNGDRFYRYELNPQSFFVNLFIYQKKKRNKAHNDYQGELIRLLGEYNQGWSDQITESGDLPLRMVLSSGDNKLNAKSRRENRMQAERLEGEFIDSCITYLTDLVSSVEYDGKIANLRKILVKNDENHFEKKATAIEKYCLKILQFMLSVGMFYFPQNQILLLNSFMQQHLSWWLINESNFIALHRGCEKHFIDSHKEIGKGKKYILEGAIQIRFVKNCFQFIHAILPTFVTDDQEKLQFPLVVPPLSLLDTMSRTFITINQLSDNDIYNENCNYFEEHQKEIKDLFRQLNPKTHVPARELPDNSSNARKISKKSVVLKFHMDISRIAGVDFKKVRKGIRPVVGDNRSTTETRFYVNADITIERFFFGILHHFLNKHGIMNSIDKKIIDTIEYKLALKPYFDIIKSKDLWCFDK